MMLDLITRLQAASGPAEDLDKAIWHATHPGETPFGWPVGIYPAYSASIDAAVTLVPRRLDRQVRWKTSADGDVRYGNAQIWAPSDPRDDQTPNWWASAATPAIALCIAALHARAGGGA